MQRSVSVRATDANGLDTRYDYYGEALKSAPGLPFLAFAHKQKELVAINTLYGRWRSTDVSEFVFWAAKLTRILLNFLFFNV